MISALKVENLADALNDDAVFREKARFFIGTVTVAVGEAETTLAIGWGQAIIPEPSSVGAAASEQIRISGTASHWLAVGSGSQEPIAALHPLFGGLTQTAAPLTLAQQGPLIVAVVRTVSRLMYRMDSK